MVYIVEVGISLPLYIDIVSKGGWGEGAGGRGLYYSLLIHVVAFQLIF